MTLKQCQVHVSFLCPTDLGALGPASPFLTPKIRKIVKNLYSNFEFCFSFEILKISDIIYSKLRYIIFVKKVGFLGIMKAFCKSDLTDTGEDSKLVHRRKRPKVDTLFHLFFSTRPSDEYDSAPSRKFSRPLLDVFACIG